MQDWSVLTPYFRSIQRKLGRKELSDDEEIVIAGTIGRLMRDQGLTRNQAGRKVRAYLNNPQHPFWRELADARERSETSPCLVCGARLEMDEMACPGCTPEFERLSHQVFECPDCHNQGSHVSRCDLCCGNGTIDGLMARDLR